MGSDEPQCQQLINKLNHSVHSSMTSSHKQPFIMQSQTDSYLSSDVSSSITISPMTTISHSTVISESYNSVKSTHVEPSSPDPLSALVGPSMNAKLKTQGAIDDVLDIFTEISADSHDDQKINDRQFYHRMPSRRQRPRAASFHQCQKQKMRKYKYDAIEHAKHKKLPQISSDTSMEISVVGKMPIHPVGHILGDHKNRTRSDSWM